MTYTGGQGPIVHLVSDLKAAASWADEHGTPWAFSDCNAGARYANFYDNLGELRQIDWPAVNATDFRDPDVKEGKQAEFLVHESFPWNLVEEIGVRDQAMAERARTALEHSRHQPDVIVRQSWYY